MINAKSAGGRLSDCPSTHKCRRSFPSFPAVLSGTENASLTETRRSGPQRTWGIPPNDRRPHLQVFCVQCRGQLLPSEDVSALYDELRPSPSFSSRLDVHEITTIGSSRRQHRRQADDPPARKRSERLRSRRGAGLADRIQTNCSLPLSTVCQ